MKIAVCSEGMELQSQMCERFGRSPYLLIVETEDMTYEALENPYATESGGVGPRLAGLIADYGVKAVLTGQCGPHAQGALQMAGIRMILNHRGTVREVVESFKSTGESSSSPAPQDTVMQTDVRGGSGRGRGGICQRRRRRGKY